MWLFKCNHPFETLIVEKGQTVEVKDADFDIVTYHFQCGKCNALITKKYAAMRGGVKAFLGRSNPSPESAVQ